MNDDVAPSCTCSQFDTSRAEAQCTYQWLRAGNCVITRVLDYSRIASPGAVAAPYGWDASSASRRNDPSLPEDPFDAIPPRALRALPPPFAGMFSAASISKEPSHDVSVLWLTKSYSVLP